MSNCGKTANKRRARAAEQQRPNRRRRLRRCCNAARLLGRRCDWGHGRGGVAPSRHGSRDVATANARGSGMPPCRNAHGHKGRRAGGVDNKVALLALPPPGQCPRRRSSWPCARPAKHGALQATRRGGGWCCLLESGARCLTAPAGFQRRGPAGQRFRPAPRCSPAPL